MQKAKIEIILEVSDADLAAQRDLQDFKRDIDSGEFQRNFTKAGARKITATFVWLKRNGR